ncbi:MAG: hypothetical protein K9M45_09280, partial [Kiritimatiellales bacterium]|nr:hypothetical protein [Kiritimatiellales bacterium]
APPAPEGARLASPDGRVVWDAADPKTAQVRVNTPATRAWWGLVGGQHCDLGGWDIRVGDVERDYAAIVLTSRDGKALESSKRMLLVAVGSAENKGMQWNAERTTVSEHWGHGPAQVNGIPAEMSVRGKVTAVYALDGSGGRAAAVPVVCKGGVSRWSIGPEYRTLWYEIEAE